MKRLIVANKRRHEEALRLREEHPEIIEERKRKKREYGRIYRLSHQNTRMKKDA